MHFRMHTKTWFLPTIFSHAEFHEPTAFPTTWFSSRKWNANQKNRRIFMRVTSRHGVDGHPDPCKREACSMTLCICHSTGELGATEPGRVIYIYMYVTRHGIHITGRVIYIYMYVTRELCIYVCVQIYIHMHTCIYKAGCGPLASCGCACVYAWPYIYAATGGQGDRPRPGEIYIWGMCIYIYAHTSVYLYSWGWAPGLVIYDIYICHGGPLSRRCAGIYIYICINM